MIIHICVYMRKCSVFLFCIATCLRLLRDAIAYIKKNPTHTHSDRDTVYFKCLYTWRPTFIGYSLFPGEPMAQNRIIFFILIVVYCNIYIVTFHFCSICILLQLTPWILYKKKKKNYLSECFGLSGKIAFSLNWVLYEWDACKVI